MRSPCRNSWQMAGAVGKNRKIVKWQGHADNEWVGMFGMGGRYWP